MLALIFLRALIINCYLWRIPVLTDLYLFNRYMLIHILFDFKAKLATPAHKKFFD